MDRTRASWGNGAGIIVALFGLLSPAPSCKGRNLPAGQCVFNSDCDNNQICAGTYCRAQCNPAGGQGDRDCVTQFGTGWHCRPSGQGSTSVCTPPNDEGYCVYSSQCNTPLVCTRDGRCANQCVTDYDCQIIALDTTATCITGTCSFRDGGPAVETGVQSDGATTVDATAMDAQAIADVPASDGGG